MHVSHLGHDVSCREEEGSSQMSATRATRQVLGGATDRGKRMTNSAAYADGGSCCCGSQEGEGEGKGKAR